MGKKCAIRALFTLSARKQSTYDGNKSYRTSVRHGGGGKETTHVGCDTDPTPKGETVGGCNDGQVV